MPTVQIDLLPLLIGFVLSLVVTVVAIYLILSLRVEQRIEDEKEETRRRMEELRSHILFIERRLAEAPLDWRPDGETASRPVSEAFDWNLHPGAP